MGKGGGIISKFLTLSKGEGSHEEKERSEK
jgi:hypothetical protein